MWGTFLSEPLRIVGLVGRYPANCLMRRMPIRSRIAPLTPKGCPLGVLRGIRPDFSGLSPCCGQVAYVLLTRAPVAGGRKQAFAPAAPRLACVKPVASVHPEPGSNSPLLVSCLFLFLIEKQPIPRKYLLLSLRLRGCLFPDLAARPSRRIIAVFMLGLKN